MGWDRDPSFLLFPSFSFSSPSILKCNIPFSVSLLFFIPPPFYIVFLISSFSFPAHGDLSRVKFYGRVPVEMHENGCACRSVVFLPSV